ncbi:MAG TPA: OsmC family protein [Plantibacter sp.]|uniref:OsmC family protein n=1 Tax=unclassified Plantibacter TaxID=2624265 RepID=UPI002CCB8963|nr:OsmC family protein [Plantibacter sp.]
MTTHRYQTSLDWEGRTTDYDGYGRQHRVTIGGNEIALSADAAFHGDPALPNPEQLVVAAASSCQLLSFLAVAALGGVEVLTYRDDAAGEMPSDMRPLRLIRIVLRPHIAVAGSTIDRVERLVRKAHEQCYIANSLSTEVLVEPVIEVV